MKTILEKFEKITIKCSLDEYKEQIKKLREGGWKITSVGVDWSDGARKIVAVRLI